MTPTVLTGAVGEASPPAVPTSMRPGGQGAVSAPCPLTPFQDWGFLWAERRDTGSQNFLFPKGKGASA